MSPEDIRIVEAIAPKLEAGCLQLYCVDRIDHESLLLLLVCPADRIKRHNQFESYILKEVIPFMNGRNSPSLHHCAWLQLGGVSRGEYRVSSPSSVW